VLQSALDTIHTLAEAAQACRGDRPAMMVKCLELDNLLLTAESITRSALYREESRGTHYREDFPDRDDNTWHCNVVVRQGADRRLQVQTAPVVTM
jgi:L-aspartate oxidase